MSVRSFAGVVGAVLIIVAATGLLWGLTLSEKGALGSNREYSCGNALRPEAWNGGSKVGGAHGERLDAQCTDAALTRRVIFWPIAGLGVLVLAGAVLIKPSRSPALSPSPDA